MQGFSRPTLLHLLPDFQAGAPLAFIIDLAKMLPEYYHILLSNRPAVEVGEYQDSLCTKLSLDVRYTSGKQILQSDVMDCRPDVVIMYDVRGVDLEQEIDKVPVLYYGYYTYDPQVGRTCQARVFGSKKLFKGEQDAIYFPPYVEHQLVAVAAKEAQLPTRKRVIALLSGRPETFDFDYATALLRSVDLGRVAFIVPEFTRINKAFDCEVVKARALDSVLICAHTLGATFNAYRKTQMLISTGCFRIDAECGILRRPVIKRPDSVEETVEIVEESLVNRKLVDELVDYGRLLAAQRQLSLHVHKFSNLIRRLY